MSKPTKNKHKQQQAQIKQNVMKNINELKATQLQPYGVAPAHMTETRIKNVMVGSKAGRSKSAETSARAFEKAFEKQTAEFQSLAQEKLGLTEQQAKGFAKQYRSTEEVNSAIDAALERRTARMDAVREKDLEINRARDQVAEVSKELQNNYGMSSKEADTLVAKGARDGALDNKAANRVRSVARNRDKLAKEAFIHNNNIDILTANTGLSTSEVADFVTNANSKSIANALKADPALAKKQIQNYTAAKNSASELKASNKAFSKMSTSELANNIMSEAGEDASKRSIRKATRNIEKNIPTEASVNKAMAKVNKAAAKKIQQQSVNQAKKEIAEAAAKKAEKMAKLGKVGKIAAGVGITAALVSNMNKSKGQQSNAELYGQRTPYGY